MSTRVWPYPDLRNGTTIHHITDTHFGLRTEADGRFPQISVDLEILKAAHAGHLHSGDMVDWDAAPTDAPEDAQYLAFRNGVKAKDGLPWAEVVGNHDLQSFQTLTARTSAQWAASMGLSSQNTVTTMGGVRIIGLGPDSWRAFDTPEPGYTLSAATLTFLDQQLTAAGSTPCFIATHVPPSEQYPAESQVALPVVGLDGIVAGHSNVVGWLSGHRHANPDTDTAHAGVATIGGRKLFVVNGPAAGGRMAGVAYADYVFKSPSLSMFVTYLGGALDVRWRDHSAMGWKSVNGQPFKHILLT